jgi:hypothetical protein
MSKIFLFLFITSSLLQLYFVQLCTANQQKFAANNGEITIKNYGTLAVRVLIQYRQDYSINQRSSDPIGLNQEYTFSVPSLANAVFLKIEGVNFIKSSKILFDGKFESFERVCIHVLGTVYEAYALKVDC